MASHPLSNSIELIERMQREHAELSQHVALLAIRLGGIWQLPVDERRVAMQRSVTWMREVLKPHLLWEERDVYPLVDDAPGSPTVWLRSEHTIITRWIDELAWEAGGHHPDVARFSRRADNLFGLMLAHLEIEEEVLLPRLDALSADQPADAGPSTRTSPAQPPSTSRTTTAP